MHRCIRLPVFVALLFVALPALLQAQSGNAAQKVIREMLREKLRSAPENRWRPERESTKDRAVRDGMAAGAENRVVSDDDAPESEVHAVINPRDSNNIIVSAIRASDDAIDLLLCPIYYTRDFGATWKRSEFQTVPSKAGALVLGGGDPILAFDADGRAYISWIDLYNSNDDDTLHFSLFWAYSDDGGATWTRLRKETIGAGATLEGDMWNLEIFDKQWMAVDRSNSPWRNTLYCVFMQARYDGSVLQIGLRKKPAGSEEFTDRSVTISGTESVEVQLASIAVDGDGGVHVTYFGVDTGGQCSMWYARSADGGETFSRATKVADLHTPGYGSGSSGPPIVGLSRVQPCPHLVVDQGAGSRRGNLYLIWSADGTTSAGLGGLDIYFSRSTDNGRHWSTPMIVNDDPRLTETHQFHPSIAVNTDGVVTATWYDRRGDEENIRTEYYMAHSFDGGLTFRSSAPVSTAATDFATVESINGGFGIGEYTQVISIPGYAIPVWSDGRSNDGNLDIYVAFVPIGTAGIRAERIGTLGVGASIMEPVASAGGLAVGIMLEKAGPVKLLLVDLLGRTVASIADRELRAGEHHFALATSGLPAGRYFLALRTNRGEASRPIDVVR